MLAAAVLWGSTGTVAAFAPPAATPVAIGAARIVVGGLLLLLVALPVGTGGQSTGGQSTGGQSTGRQATGPGAATGAGAGTGPGASGRGRGLRVLASPDVRWWAMLGAVGVAGYQAGFFSAVATTGVAVGTVVTIGSAPVFTGAVSRLTGGPPLSRRWLLATAVAIAGAAVLVAGGAAAGVHLAGVGFGLLAGFSYALYAVTAARLITAGTPGRVVMGGLFGGGAVVLLPVLLAGPLGWLVTPRGAAVVLYLGVITTAVAYLLYARGLRTTPAPAAVTLGLAEPAVAALLALAVLGERLTADAVTGIVLIGLALAVLAIPALGRSRAIRPGGAG